MHSFGHAPYKLTFSLSMVLSIWLYVLVIILHETLYNICTEAVSQTYASHVVTSQEPSS